MEYDFGAGTGSSRFLFLQKYHIVPIKRLPSNEMAFSIGSYPASDPLLLSDPAILIAFGCDASAIYEKYNNPINFSEYFRHLKASEAF